MIKLKGNTDWWYGYNLGPNAIMHMLRMEMYGVVGYDSQIS
jgi:hypothetical protein